jgi:hypothetical protein
VENKNEIKSLAMKVLAKKGVDRKMGCPIPITSVNSSGTEESVGQAPGIQQAEQNGIQISQEYYVPPNYSHLSDRILTSRKPLAELIKLMLEGNPESHKLSHDGRRFLAEHVEMGVLNWLDKFVLPSEEAIPAGSNWRARCYKGHTVKDGIFVKTLVGWRCEQCKQVYPVVACIVKSKSGTASKIE